MLIAKNNKITILLNELETRSICYVSWKNNHELNSVLSGKGDLDIFVPYNQKFNFINLCKEQNWIEVLNPIAKHPYISHFYCLGENLEVFHLHVYFKLITGDTWIKEYSLPLDKWLLNNRIWNEKYDLWVPNKTSQAYLFLARHLLKCGSTTGRLLYRLELDSYKQEWEECGLDLRLEKIEDPINLGPFIDGTRVDKTNFQLPKIITAISFKISCLSYMRFMPFTLPFRRFFSMSSRLINKIYFKKNKLLSPKGLVIALSGVDGSGKSTMLEELNRTLGTFLTVDRFHLGKPQGKVIEFLWKVLGNKSENSSMPGTSRGNIPSSKSKAFNGVVLALLRLKKARYIMKRSINGSLMLTDRWPTKELGKMDGPRIVLGQNSSWFILFCKRIETWAYKVMPEADICYFFEVPIETAKSRNESRVKQNKETEEMISARYFHNFDYKPIAKRTIHFENSGEFQIKRKEFINNVWQQISSIY